MSNWLIDPTTRALSGALDGLALREQAVASNLSNVDTPGYQSLTVDFESELQAQLAGAADAASGGAMLPPTLGPSTQSGMTQTSAAHLAATVPSMVSGGGALSAQSNGTVNRVDGNTVSVDTEMTALAETQLKYAAVSRMLTGKIGMLKDVVGAR
jgi:flagellar basal-body rod protein FlgB